MTSAQRMRPITITLVLASILGLSLWANLENNGFPLGYHFDEPLKVKSIIGGVYEFHHPALMIHISRLANLFTHYTDKQDVVELGRTMSALFGTGIVFSTFWLFRLVAGPARALLTAFAVAVSPIIVVHAHYLKEDIYFAFFVLTALLSFLRYLQSPRRARIVELGIVSGLALSSKYVGATLFLCYLLAPLVYPIGRLRVYFAEIFAVFAISLAVFLTVNYPLFLDPNSLLDDTKHEMIDIISGHTIKPYPLQFVFTFHFVRSIIPGVTAALAFAGLAGILLSRVKACRLTGPERVVLLFAALYYFLIEISPAKPFPDFMRHALPLVPVVLYFAVRAIFETGRLIEVRSQEMSGALFIVFMIWPVHDSLMLVRYLESDTRAKLYTRINQLPGPGRMLIEHYADFHAPTLTVATRPLGDLMASQVRYLAVANFAYDRYALGKTLWWQKEEVYLRARRYDALFTCAYEEIKPAFKSFAFSNPTIRIVYFWRCPERFDYP